MLSRFRQTRQAPPPDRGHEPAAALTAARLAVAWERLWPALWRPAALAGLFVALAWMGAMDALPGWLHLIVLLGFAGGIGWLLWRGLRGFRWPGAAEARRRLERDSRLPHRPLATLKDSLAGGSDDPFARALWRAAQEQARRRAANLNVDAPHPNLAARDPWAVRMAVVLLLAVGGTVAWGDWGMRLGHALTPRLGMGGLAQPALVDVWVTPPDYTGLPPIFLTRKPAPAGPAAQTAEAAPAPAADPRPLAVPQGSVLVARVTGGRGAPSLTANGQTIPFEPVAGGAFQVSAPILSGNSVAVAQGRGELGSWPIVVVPDQAPGIAFRTPPSATERWATRIDYTAADDYGVAQVTATLRLATTVAEGIDSEPMVLPMPLPGLNPKEAAASGFHDLAPHPWAGLPVTIRLEAVDAAGQVGSSPDQEFVLPERPFNHPVARFLIEERKRLIREGDPARPVVAEALSQMSVRPEAYGNRISVFLALRSTVNRLMLERGTGVIADVQQTLWDTALALEDGGLSLAERDLRDAQQRLMDALNRDAPDEELQQLMAELQQAMDQFLDALEEQMRQAMENGQQMPEMPANPDVQTLSREDLEKMMEQMQQLAQTGSKDAAREMLSQLQQMMENLQMGQSPSPQQAEQNQQMMEMLDQLQDLAQQQQELMDETFRQSQQGQQQGQQGQQGEQGDQQGQQQMGPNRQGRQPGQQQGQQGNQGQNPGNQQGQGPGSPSDMAARQEALRRQLGDVMRQLGEMGGDIPRPMGRAERSMNDAQQALGQGAPGQALEPQGEALDQLQQSLQSMAEQMMQQMQGQGMQAGTGQRRPGGQRGRDPLGRPLPGTGPFNAENVEIPEEADMQRAREILDELRRRSGEQDRPRLERDYIDRLLDRF